MKKLFKQMAVSLLTGICFTFGVVLVLVAGEYYKEKQYEESTREDTPIGVVVASHAIKPNVGKFTIIGEIRNDSPYDWETIWVDAEIYAGSALVNRCDSTLYHLPSTSTTSFELACYSVSGANLPANIRYEVHVSSGRR